MTGDELAEFLLERIAEDEADADEMWEGDYLSGEPEPGTWWKWVRDGCEAKRQVVQWARWQVDTRLVPTDRPGVYDRVPVYVVIDDREEVLQKLAVQYADHPDYRPEWRP